MTLRLHVENHTHPHYTIQHCYFGVAFATCSTTLERPISCTHKCTAGRASCRSSRTRCALGLRANSPSYCWHKCSPAQTSRFCPPKRVQMQFGRMVLWYSARRQRSDRVLKVHVSYDLASSSVSYTVHSIILTGRYLVSFPIYGMSDIVFLKLPTVAHPLGCNVPIAPKANTTAKLVLKSPTPHAAQQF